MQQGLSLSWHIVTDLGDCCGVDDLGVAWATAIPAHRNTEGTISVWLSRISSHLVHNLHEQAITQNSSTPIEKVCKSELLGAFCVSGCLFLLIIALNHSFNER